MKNKLPKIKKIMPSAAIEDGIIEIHGDGFDVAHYVEEVVLIDQKIAHKKFMSEDKIIVAVPPEIHSGDIIIKRDGTEVASYKISIGTKIADNIHCVDNPAVDREGDWYVTFSGRRDEIPPVSIFKVTANSSIAPYTTKIKNATAMAFNSDGILFVSSRFEGAIYKITSPDEVTVFAENLGSPTGLVFNRNNYLFVGDRTGKIHKISPNGEVSLFTELPESFIAYHLAMDSDDNLFVSVPTISSVSSIYMIDQYGKAVVFYAGFGRPQGMAFDNDGNLYVCEAKVDESALWCLTSKGILHKLIATPSIVGVAFDAKNNVALATPGSLYYLPAKAFQDALAAAAEEDT
jgi:sugar lactone lactonase YvrE